MDFKILAMAISAVLIGCQSPRIEYRTISIPAHLTQMPAKPTINHETATAKDAAFFIIDLNADAKMCRQRLEIIRETYSEHKQ